MPSAWSWLWRGKDKEDPSGPIGGSAWLLYLDDLPPDALDELLADTRRPLLGSVIDDMVDR